MYEILDLIPIINTESCMAIKSDEWAKISKIHTSTIKTAATYFVLSYRGKSWKCKW